jgi:lactate dehydrogenase-like 2-hydroxyacid dehydrogenase
MAKPKAIVTRRWPEAVETKLAAFFDVELNLEDRPLSPDELKSAFSRADAVLATVSDRIDAEVLSAEPLRARFLGNFGVGYNHIDVDAAKARDIAVTNTPDVLTDATADLAMTLLLMVARRAGEGERHVRADQWSGWRPTHMMGAQVTGKTLGIIGFGRIGRAVARRAHHGFDMPVLYYDDFPVPPAESRALGATACGSVEELLERADYVSLHCPGGEATRHLMNAERFARMKAGAFLINTARGDVVDEAALAQALREGRLAGAGLDVYEREPKVTRELLDMENIVLLPHLGSATKETRTAMGLKVLENAKAFFSGQELPNRVA